MTEPKEDKFIATIKQNARKMWWDIILLENSEGWTGKSSDCILVSVVLDAYAQSQQTRNQQLQQLLKNFWEEIAFLHGKYHISSEEMADLQSKFGIEAFLKATTTETTTP